MTQSPDEARPRVKGSQTAMAAAYLVAIVLGVCSGSGAARLSMHSRTS
mgnify:CR=1 FL=1